MRRSVEDELDFPLFWKTRWDLLRDNRAEQELDRAKKECTGLGNCHGCLSWCPYCGDVGDMCNVTKWPERCDEHNRYPLPPPGSDPRQLVLFEDEVVPALISSALTIHVTHHGLPICGFERPPGNWPTGHMGVETSDFSTTPNCRPCLLVFKRTPKEEKTIWDYILKDDVV
jgi:hypothetical protein